MAGWVIDQCVKDEELGGAITKDLKHATNWILDPTSNFYDAHMRKSQLAFQKVLFIPISHIIAKETTFLSLWVWNYKESQDDWNAGDNDNGTAYEMVDFVDRAVRRLPQSDDKIKLARRVDDLSDWQSRMNYESRRVWWEPD